MKKMTLLTITFLMLSTHSWAAKNVDIMLLDIAKTGYEKLNIIKENPKALYWVELGSELLLAFDDIESVTLPPRIKQRQVIKGVDQALLFLEIKGLCHSHFQQKHDSTTTSLFIQNLYEIKLADSVESKQAHLTKPCFTDLGKNERIIALAANSNLNKKSALPDEGIQAMFGLIDQDRWLNNVKYLSSFNRMEEADLVTTGDWLFDKFENLGLSVERLGDPEAYRGFNVIAKKVGTVRPDDWYVIGAHLDSMNAAYSSEIASPGAEDNASGCSGVIEIAEIFSQYETEATIVFICFAGHERARIIPDGFLATTNGSAQIVSEWNSSGNLDKVKAMFNLDMISYHEGGDYTGMVSNAHTVSTELRETFLQNALLYTSINWTILSNWRVSDHRRFSAMGVPSVMSSETTLREYFGYHNPADLWENTDPYLASEIIKANIATLADMSGAITSESSGFPISPGHSGLWFNPEQSGHGFVVLVLPENRVSAQWYVYDDSGNQVWLIGLGSYTENSDQVTLDMTITDNGFFPPDFSPEDVELINWGQLTFKFDSCHTGTAMWDPSDALNQFSAGSMEISKLASLSGLTDCNE